MDNEQLGEPPGTPGPQGYTIHHGYQGPKYPGYQGPVSYSEVCMNKLELLQLRVAGIERRLEAHIKESEGSILTELMKFVGYVGTTILLVKLFV
jgi:hypothetical protein